MQEATSEDDMIFFILISDKIRKALSFVCRLNVSSSNASKYVL